MINKNYESQLKSNLYNLLKMDYKAEIYNYNSEHFRISFFHLNSCFNALQSLFLRSGEVCECLWQYATPNKKAEGYILKILEAVYQLNLCCKRSYIEQEFEYYGNLATSVFAAKYDGSVALHTINKD